MIEKIQASRFISADFDLNTIRIHDRVGGDTMPQFARGETLFTYDDYRIVFFWEARFKNGIYEFNIVRGTLNSNFDIIAFNQPLNEEEIEEQLKLKVESCLWHYQAVSMLTKNQSEFRREYGEARVS